MGDVDPRLRRHSRFVVDVVAVRVVDGDWRTGAKDEERAGRSDRRTTTDAMLRWWGMAMAYDDAIKGLEGCGLHEGI